MSKLDEYKPLIERSRRFLETARIQMDKGFYDLTVLSLEQSLQLYLKASLLKLGVDYPRTRSVRKLLELLGELAEAEEVRELLSKYAVELGALEDAYITSRYIPREYALEEASRLFQVVVRMMEVVERAVGKGGQV